MIGNFIADHIKGNQFTHLSSEIQQGIKLHREIDTFTDAHKITRISKRRLHKRYGLFAGIIIDIFYDHYLAKNWSNYHDYGKIVSEDENWMLTNEKLGNAKFMHCLPVRRNVVVEDAVLDGENSVVIEQANNRTYAAQIVLKNILKTL